MCHLRRLKRVLGNIFHRHVEKLFVFLDPHPYNFLLFLQSSAGFFSLLFLLYHTHFFVIIQVDLLNNHKFMPVYLHLYVFLLLGLLLLGAFFSTFFLLITIPEVSFTGRFHDCRGIWSKFLESWENVISWLQDFRVRFNELSEITEKTMGWLQEVKLGVPLLPFSESLEEFLTISRHELSSELNDIWVNICKNGVTDDKLVGRIRSYISLLPALLRISTKNDLSQFPLIRVFSCLWWSKYRRSWNMLRFYLIAIFFNHTICEFIYFLKIVGTVRVIFMSQKVEFRVHCLDFHYHFFENSALFRHITRCLIYNSLDIWGRNDNPSLFFLLILQVCFYLRVLFGHLFNL